MFITILILMVAAAAAQQGAPVPAATPPAPVLCGAVPTAIYSCLGNPKVVSAEVSAQCTAAASECERLSCIFERSGWLKEGRVDAEAVRHYFAEYGASHPAWRAASERVRVDCLPTAAPLPPQGVYLNCPAFDVLHCAITAFFRNAPAEVWRGGAACTAARAFAQACPVCPVDCFATAVPVGSCNACRLLPRSA